MAKKSKVVRENHLMKKVKKYHALRTELRDLIKNINTPEDEKMKAIERLQKLPRSSSRTRLTNRCAVSGRPTGYMRKFGLSRITFRELALKGELPGVTKASW